MAVVVFELIAVALGVGSGKISTKCNVTGWSRFMVTDETDCFGFFVLASL